MPPENAQKLSKGTGNVRKNVASLMQPIRSASRKKAVLTLARKHNISRSDAQFRQAVSIARSLGRKK